jgi:hypothetical protein
VERIGGYRTAWKSLIDAILLISIFSRWVISIEVCVIAG